MKTTTVIKTLLVITLLVAFGPFLYKTVYVKGCTDTYQDNTPESIQNLFNGTPELRESYNKFVHNKCEKQYSRMVRGHANK
jgi:hypothetical protein